MANVTGAELNPIYQRLNQAPTYHPFEADAFSDWSMEAGDMVTMVRNGEEYKSPVHVARMVWKGNSPTVQISSTGNKEREPVSKTSRKKYGRGSAGIRSQEGIHRDFTSEDGILHSELHVTESYMRTEFHNETSSLRSYFDITASHMQTVFMDEINSTRSYVDITASHMQTAFADDVASMRSYVDITASHMQTAFADDMNSLKGYVDVTASHMQAAFTDDVNSLRSDFQVTASHLRTEFTDDVNSVRSYMHQTASNWEARVAPVADGNGNITPASIALSINNGGSNVKINADKIYLLGQTIADTIDANYIAAKIAAIPSITANNILAGSISVLVGQGLTVSPVATETYVRGCPWDLRITQNGNTYTLQQKRLGYEAVWTDVGSFSRATTLSAGWDGNRKFIVGAAPQGVERYTTLLSAVPNANITWNGAMATLALKATIDDGETTVDVGNVTVNVANYLQGKTGTAKITQNGTYTPDTGYIGFSEIEIDVEGGGGGGTTTLSNTWSNGHLVVSASPQGETLERWLSAGASTWDGTVVTIPINALWGSSHQYSESTGWSASANVSSKLQSKTFNSNGTKTPDAGYIGFSSVTINVPVIDVDARFGSASGEYFIGAYDNQSGNLISGSSKTYKLGVSGAKVQVQNASGSKHSGTPELTLGIRAGTLDTSTGVRTLTVTAGGANTSATVDVSDYASGRDSVTISTITKGTVTYESKQFTVPVTATASNSATKTENLTVDGTQAYNAGWAAYYNKLKWPEVPSSLSATFAVKRPNSTADSASDSQVRNYILANKDDNTVYLRYSNETYAEINHGKYTSGYNTGWARAWAKVELPGNNTSSVSMVVKTPPQTVDGTASSTTYVLDASSNNNIAYIKVGSAIKAQATHNKYKSGYDAGWGAARAKLSIPTGASTAEYLTVGYPPSTVDGDQATQKYYVTADNSMAYIRAGSASGTIVARKSHSAYSNGYKEGFNANHDIWLFEHSESNNSVLNLSGSAHRYSIRYNSKDANNNTVQNWVGGSWEVPGAWIVYDSGTADQGTLTAGSVIALKEFHYDGTSRIMGRWKVPNSGGSTPSYSVSSGTGGSCYQNALDSALAGYSRHSASGIPNSSQGVYRYIKFTVDGKKHAFYFG